MIYVRIRLVPRWWLGSYLYGVALMAFALNAEPDWQKVGDVLARGFRVELQPVSFAVRA